VEVARRKGPALTRQDVLDAALVIVARDGADALGTASVAASLGIRAPSIYHHFRGNEALRHAVAVAGWQRLLASLPVATSGSDELRAFAYAYRRFARDNAELYEVMVRTPFDPLDPDLLALGVRGQEALAGLPLEGLDRLHALRGLRAAVHGFVDLENAGQVRLGVPADDSFAWLVDVVVRGIRGRGGA
jgi:AcrR family transcriptional regulator